MAIATAQELYNEAKEIVQDPSYEFDDYLAEFNNCLKELSGSKEFLLPELETEADVLVGKASITASTISFVALTHTIADSGKALISSGFHVGDTITITGAGESGNNQATTISSMASDGSTMVVAGTLTNENAGEEITIENDSPNNIPLPSNYSRKLFRCWSVTNTRRPKVYASWRLLLRNFSYIDQSGSVLAVAVRGSRLMYQRIPQTIESLTIYYYKKATMLTGPSSQPDCLPEELVKPLLINYACKKMFAQIEDGVEGQKINTDKHEGLYKDAVADLKAFIGDEGREPQDIPDETNLEAYLCG